MSSYNIYMNLQPSVAEYTFPQSSTMTIISIVKRFSKIISIYKLNNSPQNFAIN
jgi:hypothetical protein